MDIEKTYVVGVLVTGKTPERYPLARKSVDAWLSQDYPGPRGLIVINDHPSTYLFENASTPKDVVEVKPHDRLSLGKLRNLGIQAAAGYADYLIQWDDDDYSAPSRLRYQVENTPAGAASIFRYEIHCDLITGEAFANDGKQIRCGGFPGTMLWPVSAEARFQDKGKAEDTEFVLALKKELPVKVLENPAKLYTRLYHGLNTWSRKHVMQRKPGYCNLTKEERQYVASLRQGPYFAILQAYSNVGTEPTSEE